MAVNSKPSTAHTNFTPARLAKALKAIDAKVEQYLRALEAADREESSVHQPTSEGLQNKIEGLKERQQRYHGFVQAMRASGAT